MAKQKRASYSKWICYTACLAGLGAISGLYIGRNVPTVSANTAASQVSQNEPSQAGIAPSLNLTSSQIAQQRQDAVNMMNEQALTPTILPDGTKQFNLTASEFAWSPYTGKVIQGWGFNNTIPGPLIRVQVGDKIEIVTHNLLSEPTTIHWHGLAVPNAMDGVPNMPEPAIQPNGTFDYTFTVTKQMIGTHWYHSHYDDDFQVDAGMYGVIIVDPKSSVQKDYNVDKLFTLGTFKVDGEDNENVFTINGESYPYTPQLTVQSGQRVLLRLVNASAEDYHAVTLTGYTLTIVAQDGQALPSPQKVSVVSIAPSSTMDVEFTADKPGNWVFYSTIADELSNPDDAKDAVGGMMTVIHVK
ncbi:multicopper oxidase family protein [Alicyclobacillus fodiniaquatilis]|uniref:Multicopper oxidase family protein n=1 Tax=Alicyclobacillus fodiniaquatilis TaxID=1661150 RepID=A0ABW4JHX3_9BACL